MSENTVNATLRRLGYTGDEMTAHGFRAMASTLLNESGKWSMDAIERALAHKDKDKIAGLRRRMQFLKDMEHQVQAAPDQQVSLTDPDARSMATSGRGTGMIGSIVQAVVDAEHHLIVAREVTNLCHDRTQLEPMGLKAKQATGCEDITALADRGMISPQRLNALAVMHPLR